MNGDGKAANQDDIALIRLDRPVTEKPIRVAERAAQPGTPTRILGFGTTVDTELKFAERLRELETRRGADAECAPGYADRTRLCTISRVPEAMACFGDSGGPQLQKGRHGRWELVGATSGPGPGSRVLGRARPVHQCAGLRGLDPGDPQARRLTPEGRRASHRSAAMLGGHAVVRRHADDGQMAAKTWALRLQSSSAARTRRPRTQPLG
ncbi:hypothetical protein GCM10009680_52430 [Streptomyces yatensis]|uniref:Peptidase S1 domain-containing protein n=1 Tax=Streptomyces yatensis TaxID=155177 RepID=A0ABN2IHC1_9ACTN